MQGGNNIITSANAMQSPKDKEGKPVPLATSILVDATKPNTSSLSCAALAVGPPTTPFYAANSGCMAHFFSDATVVLNKCITTNPLSWMPLYSLM